MSWLRVIGAFSCILAVRSQEAVWRLPPHGLAEYSVTGEVLADLGGRKVSILGAVSTACHPIVFRDEMDERGQRWRAPWSLDSIPMWLAWDLTTWDRPGPIDVWWPRIVDYGDVRFLGEVGMVDGYGWQQIKGRLTRRDPQPGGDRVDPEFLRIERHYGRGILDGELTVRRCYDPARGVVVEFLWSIDAAVAGAQPGAPGRLRGTKTWRLLEVAENRYPTVEQGPGFPARIDAAIERTAARQLRWLLRPDGTLADGEDRGSVHGPALQALMLWGQARAGRRVGDPGIDSALAALLARRMTLPHSHALTILAIVGLHGPRDDRRLGSRAPAVVLPPPMRAVVAAKVSALRALARRDGRGQDGIWWAFASDWRTWDSWQTWISIQALDAAVRAGVPVPEAVFEDAMRHLLRVAFPAGMGVEAVLLPEAVASPARGTQPTTSVPMTCWMEGQWNMAGMADGRATAGAMAALLCCRRHVRDVRLATEVDAAVRGGWAWLSRHWTGRHNPAPLLVHAQHRGWMALALAWLLDESGVRWLDGRDLYFEVAATMLQEERQFKGGLNGSVIETPAALVLWRPGAVDVTAPLTPTRK